MKTADRNAWWAKNERVNADRELKIGDIVADGYGGHGVVVKIELPETPGGSIEDHGTVAVWQDRRVGYGSDNCEHYTWTAWKSQLRIEPPATPESNSKPSSGPGF